MRNTENAKERLGGVSFPKELAPDWAQGIERIAERPGPSALFMPCSGWSRREEIPRAASAVEGLAAPWGVGPDGPGRSGRAPDRCSGEGGYAVSGADSTSPSLPGGRVWASLRMTPTIFR